MTTIEAAQDEIISIQGKLIQIYEERIKQLEDHCSFLEERLEKRDHT